jgi:hypothetical protein
VLRIAVRHGNEKSTPGQQRLLGMAQDVVAFIERKMSEAGDPELEVALPTLVMFLIAANIAHASSDGDPSPEELEATRERIIAEIRAGWSFGLGAIHHEPEEAPAESFDDFAICQTCWSFARWDEEREIYHCKRCGERWS